MVSTKDFIAAIELGSSKIVGMAGKKNSDGSIQVLAYAKEESSSFIRKGVIFNLDKTAQSLTSIINKLESSLDSSIGKVYVGLSGQSMHTIRHTVERNLENETVISQELIDAICDENWNTPLDDMDILDVAPQEYKIGNTLQAEPVGVPATHIEGRFLNIVARKAIKKNLERCFDLAKIEIADMLISPLVTAQAVLTENEMRSGCALVDFGADTTTVSVYKGNILRFLSVLPLGGYNITRDITSLQMETEEAEKLKIRYGSALYGEEDAQEPDTIYTEMNHMRVERNVLNDIIEARAEEIVANVWNQIELSGYSNNLLSGIVITGGASNLRNMDELLRRKSKIEKIRLAAAPYYDVRQVEAESADLKDGTLNTLFGLISSGKLNCYQPYQPVVEDSDPSKGLFAYDEDLLRQEEAAREEKKRKEEEEKKRKEEEKRRKQEEKKNKPSWIKSAFDKLSNEIFSDEDMQ